MSEVQLFDSRIEITCSVPGFRRAGISHPAGPTEYKAGHFTLEQFKQMRSEPRLAVRVLDDAEAKQVPVSDSTDTSSEEPPQSSPEPETEGVLDDEKLAGDLMSGDELADLVAHISELDSKDAELWMANGAPKTSAMPSGTSADERDAAWDAYQSLVVESAESQEAEE